MPKVEPRAATLVARGEVLIIAHRGASARAPENTLPAFRLALAARADLVELDTRHSKDGVPLVVHDEDYERTTDAAARWGTQGLAVEARSVSEALTLDAGAWKGAAFRGTRVPSLAQALDVIQPRSVPLIERKTGDAKTMHTLLAARGVLADVVVQAFDWSFLAELRALEPDLVLAALGSKALTDDRLRAATTLGVAALGWNHKHVDADLVQRAHQAGLKLWVYTVDDVVRARALVALGVDGIITNRPEAMRAALLPAGR